MLVLGLSFICERLKFSCLTTVWISDTVIAFTTLWQCFMSMVLTQSNLMKSYEIGIINSWNLKELRDAVVKRLAYSCRTDTGRMEIWTQDTGKALCQLSSTVLRLSHLRDPSLPCAWIRMDFFISETTYFSVCISEYIELIWWLLIRWYYFFHLFPSSSLLARTLNIPYFLTYPLMRRWTSSLL